MRGTSKKKKRILYLEELPGPIPEDRGLQPSPLQVGAGMAEHQNSRDGELPGSPSLSSPRTWAPAANTG
jgi:hypothetical protein